MVASFLDSYSLRNLKMFKFVKILVPCCQDLRKVNVFLAGAEKLSAGGQALLEGSVAYKQYIETNNINKSLLVLGANVPVN